jgi:hypothetical protein
MNIDLTRAERELAAAHLAELIEGSTDEYDPAAQRAVALASSVLDKLRT